MKVPANSVPAAAVIQMGLALFVIIGRKGLLGGIFNELNNFYIKYKKDFSDNYTRVQKKLVEFLK